MLKRPLGGFLWTLLAATTLLAGPPKSLPPGHVPNDARVGPLRTLNDYFPFQEVSSPDAWKDRAASLRRQVLVATGLWPLPTRTPLRAVVHGDVERDDYVVNRVFFESFPGHYVTGSLYRPKQHDGNLPGVLCPHGHWAQGRFHKHDEKAVREQIEIGAERFLAAGRYPLQSRCVQLARMGCVVFHYDMIGYADSVQMEHRAGVRESMNSPTDWGLFSPQAELRLQNMMGLQTWNSIRALDFISELPEVDASRIAVTGASGGGTQTFMLVAADDRPTVSVPLVMVSTAMQGGCTCENAPYLRIGTGNIDFAALAAPRPLGLVAADDWTVELATKGYPQLKHLYESLDLTDKLAASFNIHFKHNYNSVSRMFVYRFLNEHLRLGHDPPILERDFQPLTQEELTVWTQDYPRPHGPQMGDPHERALLRWWTQDSVARLGEIRTDADAYRRLVEGAWKTILGRVEDVGSVEIQHLAKHDRDDYTLATFLINQSDPQQQLPAVALYPAGEGNGEMIVWLTDDGKLGLFEEDGEPRPAVRELLSRGYAVGGVDLFLQGEFLAGGGRLTHAPLSPYGDDAPWQRAAAYTFGYNRPLFCHRVADVLLALHAARTAEPAHQRIHLIGVGSEAGPIAVAASAMAGEAVATTVVSTGGFYFASVDRFDDPMFVPGAVKYGDIEGLVTLCAPDRLTVLSKPDPAAAADAAAARFR